jgi:hypothetical protein
MKIQFRVEGGLAHFPGLSKPLEIDSASLPPEEAARLKQLVDDASFFDLPSNTAPPRGAADYRQYTITVQDGRRKHTARVPDPIENADLQALVDFLNKQAAQRRQANDRRQPEE